MANSIDFTALTLGALIGIGCREQIKACGRIAANTAASLAGVAAAAAQQVAQETKAQETESQPQAGQGNGEKKKG